MRIPDRPGLEVTSLDSRKWTGWDYIQLLARRIQHERGTHPLSYEWLIELRAYEARREIARLAENARRELGIYFQFLGNHTDKSVVK